MAIAVNRGPAVHNREASQRARPGPVAARGATLVDMARWHRTRVWLVASFLVVSAVTAVAIAAWVVPAADNRFARLERAAALGSATEAAARVGRAQPRAVATSLGAVSRNDQVSLWLVGADGRDIATSALPLLDRKTLPGADRAIGEALAGRRSLPADDAPAWVVALPVQLRSGDRAAVLAYATESGFGEGASSVLRRQLLYGAGLALLAAVVIGILIADRVSRRIQRIARAAERIADGDFGEPLADRYRDEIGELAASIDVMRRRLAASFDALSNERQRLSTVLDQLDEGVLAVAPDGRVELANRAARVLLGREPGTTTELAALLTSGSHDAAGLLRQFSVPADRYVSVNGRVLHVQVAPLAHGDGAAGLVVVSDRTAEHQREETERRFIANASHELRTPLAAIVAAVEVLQGGAKDDHTARDQFLDDLQHEAGRLDRLTHSLLTLARIGTGELDPVCRPIDAGQAVRHATGLLTSLANANGLAVHAEGGGEVLADEDVLEQVLLGLIGNAIKHTPPGGEIRLVVAAIDDAVTIDVSDTGDGIATDELPRIFDRFYQVDRSRSGAGFGLGLAICREFVTAMGGTIDVESEVGGGTTIRLRLRASGPVDRGSRIAMRRSDA